MKIEDYFDRISLRCGNFARWLAVALTVVVLYEVIVRYLFNNPTIWAFDTAMMVYSAMFLLGAGYVLLIKTHIKVDVITNYLPLRVQYLLDIIYYIVFFFPYLIVMIVWGAKLAISMTIAGEISNTSQWLEPIWLWRWLVPVAFFLFLLQAVAEFIRLIKSLRTS